MPLTLPVTRTKVTLKFYINAVSKQLDCSQSSIFQQDHRDIVCLTINGGQLDFQMY